MKIMSNTVFFLMTQHLGFLIITRYFKVNMKRAPVLSAAETHLLLDSADFRQLIDNHKHSPRLTSPETEFLTPKGPSSITNGGPQTTVFWSYLPRGRDQISSVSRRHHRT